MADENNNGKNGEVELVQSTEVLTITYCAETAQFNVTGLALGPVKCIGMLEYALVMVKRQDALLQAQIMQEAQRRALHIPGRR